MIKIGKVMKFVRKGHKVGRIRKDGMEESGGCLWGGHFWNRKCRKKTWWQQEFAVFKCEATANSVTGHICVNSNKLRPMTKKRSTVCILIILF